MSLFEFTYHPITFDTVTDKAKVNKKETKTLLVSARTEKGALGRFTESLHGEITKIVKLKSLLQVRKELNSAGRALARANKKADKMRRDADALVDNVQGDLHHALKAFEYIEALVKDTPMVSGSRD